MNTTLNKIREYSPCKPSWEKLLASLNKTKADDEPISFKYLLNTLGIADAVWCLRTLTYKEQCLFLADVAESMLPEFEKHSNDPAPRKCVQAIRDYDQGLIYYAELHAAAKAAAHAVGYAAYGVNSDYVDAYTGAYTGAYAAVNAAVTAAYTATINATRDVRNNGSINGFNSRIVSNIFFGDKWQEIETLFIKHFAAGQI